MRREREKRGWTQAEASNALGIAQSRVSYLVRGKWDKFSLDMLVTLATRAGRQVSLAVALHSSVLHFFSSYDWGGRQYTRPHRSLDSIIRPTLELPKERLWLR